MSLTSLANAVFVISVGVVLYVYIGYPILMYSISRVFPKPVHRHCGIPTLSVIITAYNEQRIIAAKLENTLALNYPPDKREVIVASDCSTDETDQIVRSFPEVKLCRQETRRGKTSAQNAAVEEASGEIILFSDATTMYPAEVIHELVANFADSSVGCVTGKLIYTDESESTIGGGAKGYWSYETFLKEVESRAGSLIGASGCLYAVRKSAYVALYPEACSDFLIATSLYRQGLRTIYEPEAVCYEETNRHSKKEMQMRVRVISQTFTDLWRNRDMLNPFKSGLFGLQLISHKLLRYFVPLFFFLIFISSIVLSVDSTIFAAILFFQLLFFAMAALAWFFERRAIRIRLLSIPFYFVLANLSSIIGFWHFLRGERYARWEPIRDKK